MKNFIFATALTLALSLHATKPLTVGHRGSLYGLENSVESFTTGAKMGFDFLETDIRVTKDTVFVCSHDEDLNRLGGGDVKIAESTLEELQAIPLTQDRRGTVYHGNICSMQQYLDICRENGVRPLIELKWGTGVNNNDFSNIPRLIEFIDKNGFRDSCIILTSMKNCLEYIRKNYPDIELQFLTGQYWPNHFDWCVDLGLDVDIQKGHFDADTVKKFHDKGLKVNMWTTNVPDEFKEFVSWGCDFITSDQLAGVEE